MNIGTPYKTSDFWIASSLVAIGKKVIGLEWLGKRAFFIFDDPAFCQNLEHAYWAGDLKVSAKYFSNAQRELKDRLFQTKNSF